MPTFPCNYCTSPPGTCRNQLRNSPRGCELAESDPLYREHFNRLAMGLPVEARTGDEPPLPGTLAMARNFAQAVAGHLANGAKTVSDEAKSRRLAICRGCEWFRPSDSRCSHQRCGCHLDTKAAWESSECPVGKWGPIRLGILSPGCNVGGAEMWMRTLLGSFDRDRIIPAGIAVRYPQWVNAEMKATLEEVAPVGVGTDAVDALWQACDVVLVWGVPSWDQRLPDRPRRVKAILVSHGVGPWTVPIFANPDSADGWVAVSTAALDPIPQSHKSRAVVLGNGVDLKRLKPDSSARERIRAELEIPDGQRVVMYLGRVSDEKNPRAFIECAAECERRHPGRFAFVVVGDGLGWDKETAYAADHAPHARFVGVQRNVGDWLAAADHVVMPSHEEADSLALLESFAAGVPVVSTRVGRLREAEYAALARVVEIGPDAGTLADALEVEATDPGVSVRVEAARRVALTRHTAEAMAERWTDYLESLCNTKPSSSSSITETTPQLTGTSV